MNPSKLNALREILRRMESVVVAFSGGVDSSLLLRVAIDVLGYRVYAVIAASSTYPEREIKAARALARKLKVRHEVIVTEEMGNSEFTANPPLRCYHCKKELMRKVREIADREGIRTVIDGQNADDSSDYRPGAAAAVELGVRSPLKEVGMSKAEIRTLSRKLGLPTWDKPSLACLASRFPYHTPITKDALEQVGKAEEALRKMGFGQLRVRHHGTIARIEVLPVDFKKVLDADLRPKIMATFKKLGYFYVTLDLSGYRTGSMNEALGREMLKTTKPPQS
jgi:uncharacterized protein